MPCARRAMLKRCLLLLITRLKRMMKQSCSASMTTWEKSWSLEISEMIWMMKRLSKPKCWNSITTHSKRARSNQRWIRTWMSLSMSSQSRSIHYIRTGFKSRPTDLKLNLKVSRETRCTQYLRNFRHLRWWTGQTRTAHCKCKPLTLRRQIST